jgi:hypothetical protein
MAETLQMALEYFFGFSVQFQLHHMAYQPQQGFEKIFQNSKIQDGRKIQYGGKSIFTSFS